MSIHQLNIYGEDLVQVAINRIKTFEPEEGYYLAFSGGKDSVVCKALCDMAGVKYDAHYTVTSVDPPELVQFVKTFDDVSFDFPTDKDGKVVTMWNIIPKHSMPSTRIVRYCCADLKESRGKDRFVITGVRKAESTRRMLTRGGVEFAKNKSSRLEVYDPDNPTPEMMYICKQYYRKVLNPIFDWSTEEVWEFIKEYKVKYCCLYDYGFTRLGCIGCPMGGHKHMKQEFDRYPKYKENYIRAFDRMLKYRHEHGLDGDGKQSWKSGSDVLNWWMHGGCGYFEDRNE